MKTPQNTAPNLQKKLGLSVELYLKREDLHPYGSHKGRSIPGMIAHALEDGWQSFVISSSGNAAIAAAHAVLAHNTSGAKPITLTIFVGQNINEKKYDTLKKMTSDSIHIEKTDRPMQAANQWMRAKNAYNLRQSIDDSALIGYKELAEELQKINNLSHIFIPASSGTLAEGLGKFFIEQEAKPELHIVQTAHCHGLLKKIQGLPNDSTAESSIADAIVDKLAYRSEALKEIIEKTAGNGWIPAEEEIEKSMTLLREENIDATGNGALALAGLISAQKTGWAPKGPTALLICGK